MPRLGRRLTALVLLAACAGGCAPEPPPPTASRAVGVVRPANPDSVRRADSLAVVQADWERRVDLYSGELDSLVWGHGPSLVSGEEMGRWVAEIDTGRFRGLHGVVGPTAFVQYDLNGDGLSDRYLATGAGRVHTEGALYLQREDGRFDLAGTMRLAGFSVCPDGDGSAVVHTLGGYGLRLTVEFETYRVSRGGIESLYSDSFDVVDPMTDEEDPERARRADELGARLHRRRECVRDCDFTGTCFGADRERDPESMAFVALDDAFEFEIAYRADSLRVRMSSSGAARDSTRWRLTDPSGVQRASGVLGSRDRAEVVRGPAQGGTWVVAFDGDGSRRVSASAGWWDVPRLRR